MDELPNLAGVTAGRTPRQRRARLTPDEQRHIVGLYADPEVSTTDIRQRFAISETSLYRLLQKHGVPLRGRKTSRTSRIHVQSTDNRAPAVTAGRKQARGSTSAAASPNGISMRGFRIEFQGERIVVANSVQDALLQTLLAGATDVTSIVQQ